MGERLEGKVCIVTGAAQGIGVAYARALAREGADVAIIDLKRIDQAGPVVDDIEALGRRAVTIEADVSGAEQMVAMGKQVVDTFNASMRSSTTGAHVRPAHRVWDDFLAVNFMGVINASNAVVPYFWEQRGGSIVNISSNAAFPLSLPMLFDIPEGAPAPTVAGGLRHDEVDAPPSDQDDGAAARVTEHPRQRGVSGRDHVATTKAVVPGVIVDQLVATSALKSSLEPEDMTASCCSWRRTRAPR